MAGMVTSMSVKAMAAVVAVGEGHTLNVKAACAEAKVSRKTFYKWVARYRAEGLAGLEDRSRRPHRSPGQTPAAVEEAIVRWRKDLTDAGLDNGPMTIQSHLGADPVFSGVVPVVSTIHRVLVRHELVVPQPKKRPKSSWRRFEAPAPNEVWQIDAMDWVLATGEMTRIFNIIDDHSRVAVKSRAVFEATTAEAWATFSLAATSWGTPAGVLSDNGLCFSGKLRGFEVAFEANLRDAGVRPFTGRPFHPQTTGKVERFQQTLKKWLRARPLAGDLAGLQAQLEEFCHYYNYERPHQGIGRITPASRWHTGIAAQPATEPLSHPDYRIRRITTRVTTDGKVTTGRFVIHVGVPWRHEPALIIIDGQRASVFIDGTLIRHLELDHTRNYQPSGRKRGGPARTT